MMHLFLLATLAMITLEPVSAFWRLQCKGVAGVYPMDPLISPGEQSTHMHTFKGSGGLSMTSTADDLLQSNCTSCEISQDHSAYWAPPLYFMGDDGTVEAVPEVSDHLTYYKYVPATVDGVLTFPSAIPNGFKMISGDPYRRNFSYPVPDPPEPWSGADGSQDGLMAKAVGFNCLNYAGTPEKSLGRHTLPEKSFIDANCPDGLRLELLFPICWNGVDLTSANFRDHVKYSSAGLDGGSCPPGTKKVINQLFFETIYSVANYKGRAGRFALANGDPTGNGYHGDVIIAWEAGVLDAATQQCGPVDKSFGAAGISADCPLFKIVSDDDMRSCHINPPAMFSGKNFEKGLTALPGNNPLSFGPAPAVPGHASGGSGVASGNILVAKPAAPSSSSSPAAAAAPPPSSTSSSSSSTSTTSSAPSPPPSPPPQKDAMAANTLPIIATSYYTTGREVVEMIVVQKEVTVTLGGDAAVPTPTPPAAMAKRHGRERRHAHHRRGGSF